MPLVLLSDHTASACLTGWAVEWRCETGSGSSLPPQTLITPCERRLSWDYPCTPGSFVTCAAGPSWLSDSKPAADEGLQRWLSHAHNMPSQLSAIQRPPCRRVSNCLMMMMIIIILCHTLPWSGPVMSLLLQF